MLFGREGVKKKVYDKKTPFHNVRAAFLLTAALFLGAFKNDSFSRGRLLAPLELYVLRFIRLRGGFYIRRRARRASRDDSNLPFLF